MPEHRRSAVRQAHQPAQLRQAVNRRIVEGVAVSRRIQRQREEGSTSQRCGPRPTPGASPGPGWTHLPDLHRRAATRDASSDRRTPTSPSGAHQPAIEQTRPTVGFASDLPRPPSGAGFVRKAASGLRCAETGLAVICPRALSSCTPRRSVVPRLCHPATYRAADCARAPATPVEAAPVLTATGAVNTRRRSHFSVAVSSRPGRRP